MKGLSLSLCVLLLAILPSSSSANFFRHDDQRKSHDMIHDRTTLDEPPPIKRVNKPGACPSNDGAPADGRMDVCSECEGDSDCLGEKKCCSDTCGKLCLSPETVLISCSLPCPKINNPVCGSDGVTYSSECILRLTKCNKNQDFIEIVKDGQCQQHHRDEKPCRTELEKYHAPGKKHLIGSKIPQCLDNGLYKPMQCWGSVGTCWCVTQNGVRIETPQDERILYEEDCLKYYK